MVAKKTHPFNFQSGPNITSVAAKKSNPTLIVVRLAAIELAALVFLHLSIPKLVGRSASLQSRNQLSQYSYFHYTKHLPATRCGVCLVRPQ